MDLITSQHPSFPASSGIYTYKKNGFEINLYLDERVCPPSEFSLQFCEFIQVKPGEKVIDLGTGSGLLAIVAAKQGANVYATEPNEHSAAIAQQNFTQNNAEVNFEQGEYFANFTEQFDIIIANLPQEIIPPSMLKVWNTDIIQAVDGGTEGNTHVLELLRIAPKYMHDKSRLITVAYTGAFYEEILKTASENYNVEILGKRSGRVRDFIEQESSFFEPLLNQKKILLHEKDGHLYADGIFLSLTKKKGSPSV